MADDSSKGEPTFCFLPVSPCLILFAFLRLDLPKGVSRVVWVTEARGIERTRSRVVHEFRWKAWRASAGKF